MTNDKEETLQETEKKTTKQKVIFGLKIAGNAIFYLIILLVLIFSIGNIRAKSDPSKIPNVFGKGYLSVQTNSMESDAPDAIFAGDLIIVDILDKDEISKEVQVGDVITFFDETLAQKKGAGKMLNTHRVVYIVENEASDNVYYTIGDKVVEEAKALGVNFDYKTAFQNKTDEEALQLLTDTFGSESFEIVAAANIRGELSGCWSGFGKTIDFVNKHFRLVIILPIVAFLIFEIVIFVMNLIKFREEKVKLSMANDSTKDDDAVREQVRSELEEQIRRELLEEMAKKEEKEKSEADSEEQ